MPSEPTVHDGVVTLTHDDSEQLLSGVRLWVDQAVDVPRVFDRVEDGWQLTFPVPPVGRLEYLLELVHGDHTALVVDPANPRRVAGVYGDHSWLPMPGYHEPAWLSAPAVDGERAELEVPTPLGPVPVQLWAPVSGEGVLPLLISHDGPEMDAYGRLTRFVAAMIAAGELPPLRVALLPPRDRNPWYSANPAYACALVDHVLPALGAEIAIAGRPVLIGQSLGGLAALHAAWTHPGAFAGILTQSGSFFTAATDPQESGFETWGGITAFTAQIAAGPVPALPPVTVVCGTAEENLANNRRTFDALQRGGVDVTWGDIGDGHTWTCWRDLLDPHLTSLLRRVWSAQGAPEE